MNSLDQQIAICEANVPLATSMVDACYAAKLVAGAAEGQAMPAEPPAAA